VNETVANLVPQSSGLKPLFRIQQRTVKLDELQKITACGAQAMLRRPEQRLLQEHARRLLRL